MPTVKFLIVFGLVVAVSCSSLQIHFRSHSKGRIVNGQDALSGQFSYFAVLQKKMSKDSESNIVYSKDSEYTFEVCGGALIGMEWVLTAAHCVIEAHSIEVYLGSIDNDSAEECYIISREKISMHPDYKREAMRHDIALINIPKTTVCDTVQIVPLPKLTASSEYSKYYNEYAFISGVGETNSEEFAAHLQWARLLIIDNNDCAKYLTDATKDEMWAKPSVELGSPSSGDSGGPLVLESTGELVGITVAVSALGADKGLPILFARVTNYLEWIKSITGIYY